MMVNTPSNTRRKLGNICVNTPGTNGSLKSTGSALGGSFKKPLTPMQMHHHRSKDEHFVKPLGQQLLKPPASSEEMQVQCTPLKAVPSLPTVYEAEIETWNPPTSQELRDEWDPLMVETPEDISWMPVYTDESGEEDDSQKENMHFGSSNKSMQKVNLAKPSKNYRREAKKASSNFSRLLTLDEICDLA